VVMSTSKTLFFGDREFVFSMLLTMKDCSPEQHPEFFFCEADEVCLL